MTTSLDQMRPANNLMPVEQSPLEGLHTAELATPFGDATVLDRLRLLHDTYGFLPTSGGEINETFSLHGHLSRFGDAAGHLDSVLSHQTSRAGKPVKSKDPSAAVRNIAGEYGSYAKKARTDTWALSELAKDLAETNEHGASHLTLAATGFQTGIPHLVRYYDLVKLAADGTSTVEPFMKRSDGKRSPLDPYTILEPTREMKQHIQTVASSITISELLPAMAPVIADQQARKAFWTERLLEIRRHEVAAPVANAALQTLGVAIEERA